MPYTMDWLQEGKVIISRAYGTLTLHELRASMPKHIAMLNSGMAPVHILTDISSLKLSPANPIEVRDSVTYLSHPAMGWHAFYGSVSLASSLINVYSQVMRVHVKVFNNYEQAIKFLAEQDPLVLITPKGSVTPFDAPDSLKP